MKDFLEISSISALEVLDSRGNPTIQVEVITEGGFNGVAISPSGASTGKYEAFELRDEDNNRYDGKGVLEAVNNVNKIISKKLVGKNIYSQRYLDQLLIDIDGSTNKTSLGANAILATSIAIAKAASNSLGLPLYNYLGGINSHILPKPMMNILNGGKHSDNNLSIQEFMIVPNSGTFATKLETGVKVYNSLKSLLKSKGLSTNVGDEGGFAPNISSNEDALDLIIESINSIGLIPGIDVSIALDLAASEMYNEAKKNNQDGYLFWKTGEFKTKEEMINYLVTLTNSYPIISIEDGLAEEDWKSWKTLTSILGKKVFLVGDDLFVTNYKRLQKGISLKTANSILIKPNQIGTITETLDTIELAKSSGYLPIISHRSGETEDTTISDLAVATNSIFIKAGAPCRTDRVCKYNRLLNIEKDILN